MIIYDSAHPGKSIAATDEQRRLRREDLFSGFFTRAVLEEILESADCAGVRFYNAAPLASGERQMVAVGVEADGGELKTGYFMSGTGRQAIGRTSAFNIVMAIKLGDTATGFTSFFSKTMLEETLSPDHVSGIRFYKSNIGDFATHLGVAADANGGALETGSSHMLSDLPCPGRCALRPEAASRRSVGQPTDVLSEPLQRLSSFAMLDTEKYLPKWD